MFELSWWIGIVSFQARVEQGHPSRVYIFQRDYRSFTLQNEPAYVYGVKENLEAYRLTLRPHPFINALWLLKFNYPSTSATVLVV